VAPTGGVLSGQAVQVGALFGVTAFDAIGGAGVEVDARRGLGAFPFPMTRRYWLVVFGPWFFMRRF
jgi:predicted RecA/RadA family phage recombinase